MTSNEPPDDLELEEVSEEDSLHPEFKDWEDDPERTPTQRTNEAFKKLSPEAQKMLRADCTSAVPRGTTHILIIAANNGQTFEAPTGFYYQYVYYKGEQILRATKVLFVRYATR